MGKFTIINEGNKLPSLEGCCLNQEGWAWVDKDRFPESVGRFGLVKVLWLQFLIYVLSGQKTRKVTNNAK